MRIGIDGRSLLSTQLTGIGVYTYELLRSISLLGHRHDIVIWANSWSQSLSLPREVILDSRVHVHMDRYPNRLLTTSLVLLGLPRLDSRIGGCDVWWSPHLTFTSLSREIPHVVTMHDVSFEHFPEVFSLKRQLWHAATRPASQLSQATAVIAVSEATRRDVISSYGVSADRVHAVYSGLRSMGGDASSAVNDAPWPHRYLLFVGTVEPRKHLPALLDAFALADASDPRRISDPLHLMIVGPNGWRMDEWKSALGNSSLRQRVHRIPYPDNKTLSLLYKNARALVWPSLYEGFGFPPLEAMRKGCPVIVSSRSSLPEVVGDAGILVNPENPGQIARAILLLENDEHLRQEYIRRGNGRLDRFSWDTTARETLAILEGAASAHAHATTHRY